MAAVAMARDAVAFISKTKARRRDPDMSMRWDMLCKNAAQLGYNPQQLLCMMILFAHTNVSKLHCVGDAPAYCISKHELHLYTNHLEFITVTFMPKAGDELLICNTSLWLHELLNHVSLYMHVLYRERRMAGGRTLIRLLTLDPDLNAH